MKKAGSDDAPLWFVTLFVAAWVVVIGGIPLAMMA